MDTALARRNVEVLREVAAAPTTGKERRVVLRFCVSPVAIVGDERVEAVEVVRNELVADESGQIRAVPTEEREVIPCGIVLRSVGYRGTAISGVPFDERRATIRNDQGRVARRGRCADPRALLRRLDQARAERRDRHEQEGCDRDGGAAARGRRGGPAPGAGRGRHRRSLVREGRRAVSAMRAGRRSTPSSAPAARSRADPASSSATGTSCSRPARSA